MSSILDTATIYNTYADSVSGSNADSLKSKLSTTGKDTDDEQLMSACKDFESYFVQKIIEQAKTSIAGDSEEDGEYMKYFGDILNKEYADMVSDGDGVGLAQQLYDSMKRNTGITKSN